MPAKIVFVDDSKSVLKTFEILLKERVQSGEIVLRTFSKSAEFLEAVEAQSIDFCMLFLDINMPVFSGYDILQKLKKIEAYKEIPVIALTTESTKEALDKGKDLGFDDWIIKISATTTLLNAINSAIDKYLPKQSACEQGITDKFENISKEDAVWQMKKMFTTIEELNKKLITAEENKSRFLSLIHNEFNNPLMSVTMMMKDIIEDDSKTKEQRIDALSIVFADILTLNNQLSNILAAAEIESSAEMAKNFTNFSMQDLIADIIDSQQFIYKDKSIKVSSALEFPEPIYNDRDKFFLILRNLIENAFEFSPEESAIYVNGCVENDSIVFFVKNQGNQIKEQSRMYDAFYQERSDFSRVHHGLGLGLAIVKHFVTFLGGVVFYSVDGGFNIFKISLPLDPDAKRADVQNISSMVFEENVKSGSRF